MIVYVPIEGHGFAFLDTVTMRFVEVGDDQVFLDLRDLREAGGTDRLVAMAEAASPRRHVRPALIPFPGWPARGDYMSMNIKQNHGDAMAEADELTAVMHRAHCRSFRHGAQAAREMLARFVEQGGDWRTAASIRANWNPEWGPDPGPPVPTDG